MNRPARRPAPNNPRTRARVKAAPRRVPAAAPAPKTAPARSLAPAAPAVAAPAPATGAALAALPTHCDFDRVDSTSMFDTLGGIRALPSTEVSRALTKLNLAQMRGYERDDLMSIAEVGYNYLRSGGVRLAQVIFEGLTAVSPDEAYFWLALGLVHDRRDDPRAARKAYEKAIALDPRDATPEVNIAELDLADGKHGAARRRLQVAERKARRAGQDALARKAAAVASMIAPAPALAR